MGTLFADGFDQWASLADMLAIYTSQGTGGLSSGAGNTPFGVGQSLSVANIAQIATFTTGTNEATVYGSVRWKIQSGGGGCVLTFNDGGSAQCNIRWNGDGSIGLYTGSGTATLIQSYAAQFTASVWYSYQFKIVIDNTVGSIEIRTNGATSNTITKTGINTRGGTAVAQVNGLSLIGSLSITCLCDDLFVTNSGWPGDLRAIQQVPKSTTQTQFSVFPTTTTLVSGNNAGGFGNTLGSGTAFYKPFTSTITGSLTSLVFGIFSTVTGNVKVALFDATGSGGGPGNVLRTANVVNNATSGPNTATFSSPVTITNSTLYYVGFDQDTSVNYRYSANTGCFTSTTAYTSFPVANPTTVVDSSHDLAITLTITNDNCSGVYELKEDGDTTYVSSTTVSEDKYALSAIATSYAVTAVQVYVMWKKPDVGSRTAALSMAAHGSADTTLVTDSAIPNSYVYRIKTMDVDTTSAAWTADNINGAIIGVSITA